MRASGSTTGASAYGTTSRTPRTSSPPPPSRASPSNVIDVDKINDTTGENGDGAEAPATSTSARRCRSVASAPTRPNRPLDPFSAPKYSESAYAGSSKGKGGPSSKGGKQGVSSREEFAGVAPSGRVVMSGATTGLEVLERALAGWAVLHSSKGGGPPPCMHPKLCKLYGRPSRAMQNTIKDSARASKILIHTRILQMHGFMRNGSILMKISLAIRGTTTDVLPLFSVRTSRQFLDTEAKHLDIQAIQERTVVGRRAEYLQLEKQRWGCPQRLGRPILAVECPENASYHSNEPVQLLLRQ